MISPIFLITALLILAGVIVLQVYLSRRAGRWPGLILPILSFGLSLVIVLSAMVFSIQRFEGGGIRRTGGRGIRAGAPGAGRCAPSPPISCAEPARIFPV